MPKPKPALKVERVAVTSLHMDPANARKHPDRNLAAIRAALARFGQQTPIVVDVNNIVRKGNGTLAAAVALGWTEVDIVRSTLHGSEATAYAIADNQTGLTSTWDDTVLAEQLDALIAEGIPGSDMGFDDTELEKLLGQEPELEPATGESQLGDMKFQVMIDCVDEADQIRIVELLEKAGVKCRPMML